MGIDFGSSWVDTWAKANVILPRWEDDLRSYKAKVDNALMAMMINLPVHLFERRPNTFMEDHGNFNVTSYIELVD